MPCLSGGYFFGCWVKIDCWRNAKPNSKTTYLPYCSIVEAALIACNAVRRPKTHPPILMDVHPKQSSAMVAPCCHNSASISLNRNELKTTFNLRRSSVCLYVASSFTEV